METKPKRKSPDKSHLVANNVPTEKLSKQSNSKNPVGFKIRDPYDPKKTYRYERRVVNGLPLLVEIGGAR